MTKISLIILCSILILLHACSGEALDKNKALPINDIDSLEKPLLSEEKQDNSALLTMEVSTTEKIDSTPSPQKEEKPSRKPASILFDTIHYKYDTIMEGDIVDYKFEFTNKGERPLVIKEVSGSCGCTIGSKPFLDIPPRGRNFIKARFDSKGKVGHQKTTITVECNGMPKIQKLTLEGFVQKKEID